MSEPVDVQIIMSAGVVLAAGVSTWRVNVAARAARRAEERIEHEMRPNSGKSLHDILARVERRQLLHDEALARTAATLDAHLRAQHQVVEDAIEEGIRRAHQERD